jgi:hypothetical protein
MKLAPAYLAILLLAANGVGQVPSAGAKPASSTAIEGIVTKDPDHEPVKKAVIELIAESQTEGGNYTAVTAADGIFRIEGIVPGRYRLFAERVGLLEADKHRARSDGRVLTLASGQEVKDLQIRMQAAAVVRGRITDEDGEPLPNATVSALRQTFASGHSRWEQAGSERTNDLGEYRIASLPAGNYYVSVTPPPDFKTLIEEAGRGRSELGSANVPEKPTPTYQPTYYPGTTDRSQAAAIQLRAGDEFPVNLSLAPSPSLSIRGAVVNLPPQSTASIMLQSRDFGLVLNGAEMHGDGSFVIRDVAPGAYTILATVDNSAVPMTARQSLQVASSVGGLRLAPQPGAVVRGRLQLERKGSVGRVDVSQIFLSLQSGEREDDTGEFTLGQGISNLAQVQLDGSFEWKDVPPGNYHVQLAGKVDANQDWFVKSELVGGRAADEAGFSVNGGTVALDLVVSANGAVVEGFVTDRKGEAVANAVIVAVPEARLRARLDRYRKTVSDQSGRFTLHGIPPGDYTLFAWESVDGEAYYDPEFLKSCEGQGIALHVSEGDRKNVVVQAIAGAEEQE